MKIHALLNIYNDRTFLPACLESVQDVVDSIIVADGAYMLYYESYKRLNRDAMPWSTDGTLEIIKSMTGLPPITWVSPPLAEPNSPIDYECWPNQTDKRTALIEQVPIGDWFIIIDADELLMGDPKEAMEAVYDSGCLAASTPMYSPGTHEDRVKVEWHPRTFKKMEKMHYKGSHWHLRDKYGRIIEERYPIYWTDVMALVHLKPFKTQTRLIPHQNYMVELAGRGWLEPTDLGKVLMKDEP